MNDQNDQDHDDEHAGDQAGVITISTQIGQKPEPGKHRRPMIDWPGDDQA